MSDDFVHGHVHSALSFLDGLAPVDDLVARAAQIGQPGIALTDHGNLYGTAALAGACKRHGLRPIIGMEGYEAVPHRWDPENPEHAGVFKLPYDPANPRFHHLTLWVLDGQGWRNLCKLHTQSYTAAFKPKNQPLIDRDSLERYSDGLAVGLGCIQSRSNHTLRHADLDAAYQNAKWYAEVFEGRCWLEIMGNIPEQVALIRDQRLLATKLGVPVLGTNDVHYVQQSDGQEHGPHHLLVQARRWKRKEGEAESGDKSDAGYGRWYGSDDFFLKTRQQMLSTPGMTDLDLDQSLALLEAVSFDFSALAKPAPPSAPVPAPGEDKDFDAWLTHAA